MITSAGRPPISAAATTPVAPIPPIFTAPVVTSPPRQGAQVAAEPAPVAAAGQVVIAAERGSPGARCHQRGPPARRQAGGERRRQRGAQRRGRALQQGDRLAPVVGPGPDGCPTGRPAAQRRVAGAGQDRGGARGDRRGARGHGHPGGRPVAAAHDFPARTAGRDGWPGTGCRLAGVGAGLGPGAVAPAPAP